MTLTKAQAEEALSWLFAHECEVGLGDAGTINALREIIGEPAIPTYENVWYVSVEIPVIKTDIITGQEWGRPTEGSETQYGEPSWEVSRVRDPFKGPREPQYRTLFGSIYLEATSKEEALTKARKVLSVREVIRLS